MSKNDGIGGKVDYTNKMQMDNVFFSYIGLEKRGFKKRLEELKKLFRNGTYRERNVSEISSRIVDRVFGIYIFQNPEDMITRISNSESDREKIEWQYLKEQLQSIGELNENYNDDLDIAMFMLIGSYCSDFCGYGIRVSALPFLDKDGKCSTWCRVLQDVIMKSNRMRLIDLENVEKKEHQRIEKYSYKRCIKLHTELYETICDVKNELNEIKQQKKAKKRMDFENRKREIQFMSTEGIENYFLEDMMFGLSFTTILYHYMKNFNLSQLEQMEKIVDLLAKLKCFLLRNRITDMVFFYLVRNSFEDQSIMNISNYLDAYVEKVNKVYTDLLCIEWSWTWNDVISKNPKQVIWQKFIIDDFYDVQKSIFFNDDSKDQYILKRYFEKNWYINTPYNDELQMDIENEMGMVHSTSVTHGKNNSPSYEGLQMILQIKVLENTGISLDEIENNNEIKWRKKEEIRTGKAEIKEKQVAYTMIHKMVMVALKKNSGKNPTV